MTEIILHFDADANANIKALAADLQSRCAGLDGVEHVEAEAVVTRGINDIVVVLNVAATVLTSGASALVALKLFIESVKGVGTALGLRNVKVEDGMDQVTPEALTDDHVKRLVPGKAT